MSARSLMVMGTASDVGKSVIVAGLCRLFARAGIRVAPFKAQNMSNNAAVCPGGGEIGRAQAVQAEAAGLSPSSAMNPVLLKPESETGCQVVIDGRARFHLEAREHHRYRAAAWPAIVRAYNELSTGYELIIIEGAGGAAELNLRASDIVNWPVAELADAPVLLVADIERGGAIASVVGTVGLLAAAERRRLTGFIINKFRGDATLFDDGLEIITARTRLPALGVLPYLHDLAIPQEDSASLDLASLDPASLDPASLDARRHADHPRPLTVGVIRLPRIANFTDFDGLAAEPDVAVHYLERPDPNVDLLCLPGSKSTVADLGWLRAQGFAEFIRAHHERGGWILGICGGYQMLGHEIHDPEAVESPTPRVAGFGLLPITTVFARDKVTAPVKAYERRSGLAVSGYEIHHGRILPTPNAFSNSVLTPNSVFTIIERDGRPCAEPEGATSLDGRVIGTAIHGLCETPGWRRALLDRLRTAKGLAPLASGVGDDLKETRRRAYDRLADTIVTHLDVKAITASAGFPGLLDRR